MNKARSCSLSSNFGFQNLLQGVQGVRPAKRQNAMQGVRPAKTMQGVRPAKRQNKLWFFLKKIKIPTFFGVKNLMARKRRYHIPGAFYHVMLRGNDGQTIFFKDEERCRFCLLIQEGTERYGHRIHAFCLMGNHLHLLVQAGIIPLSVIMQNLAFRYSQFINRRHKKIGHLFQGRFKAILIEEENYFLRLLRYIHMNPVRAHLVKNPEDYFWSGHGAYIGQKEFIWLTTNYGLKKFADQTEEAHLKYQDYVLEQEQANALKEIRQGFSDGQILGNDEFLDGVRCTVKETSHLQEPPKTPLEGILRAINHIYEVDEMTLTSPSQSSHLSFIRGAAAAFAKQKGIPFATMAKVLKRDESSVGKLARGFSKKIACNPDAQCKYRQLEEAAANFAALPV